jgi:hypothetical protein
MGRSIQQVIEAVFEYLSKRKEIALAFSLRESSGPVYEAALAEAKNELESKTKAALNYVAMQSVNDQRVLDDANKKAQGDFQDRAAALNADADDLMAGLIAAGRAEVKKVRDANRFKVGETPAVDMTPHQAPYDNMKGMQLAFVGFSDLWKKVQESISGTSIVAVAKQQRDAAQKATVQLDQLIDLTGKNKPMPQAPAVGGEAV